MQRVAKVIYLALVVLFLVAAAGLVVLAAMDFWKAFDPFAPTEIRERFFTVLQAVGILTVAVAAVELGETIYEEDVVRKAASTGSPTRVRRFLSRFLTVIVVAGAIEFLVVIYRLAHHNPAQLPSAAALAGGIALLMVGWGVFIYLNRRLEDREPEEERKGDRERPEEQA